MTCNGDADGSISVTASGGTAGYTYLWDDASAQTTTTATGLAPGNYTVTVTDANGCTFTTTPAVTITELTAITAVLIDTNAAICNGAADGQAIIQISGGQPSYDISWTGLTVNGTTYSSSITDFVNASGDKDTIKTFPSGTYDVTVTDDNGCSIVLPTQVVITEPNAISLSTIIRPDLSANGYEYKGINIINNTYLYYHSGTLEWQAARNKAIANGGDLIAVSYTHLTLPTKA